MGRLGLGLWIVFLGACASRDGTAPRPTPSDPNNPFFVAATGTRPTLLGLFEGTPALAWKRAFEGAAGERLGRELAPAVWLVGESSPHSFVFRSDTRTLQPAWADATERGPWWWDVLRAETGLLVVAAASGLKNATGGAVIEGYATGLLAVLEPTGAPAREVSPLEALPEPPALESQRGVALTHDERAGFGKALPAGVKAESGFWVEAPTRHPTLVGGDHKTYDLWPVAVTSRFIPGAPADIELRKTGCDRVLAAARAYADSPARCLATGNDAYLLDARTTVRRMDGSSFRSMDDLNRHARVVGRWLGERHAKQWSSSETRSVWNALQGNPLLRARLKSEARGNFETLDRAYRDLGL